MYTRVVELTSKSEKSRELANTINDQVLEQSWFGCLALACVG